MVKTHIMKKLILTAVLGLSMAGTSLRAQSEPFIGQIAYVAFTFDPVGWAECNGQSLPINQNTALFSLLGTTYGGDGITTFKLPDMRGRVVLHSGQGAGLSDYFQGEMSGVEAVTLTTSEMPQHSHTLSAVAEDGNESSPTGNLPANTKTLDKEYSSSAANTTMRTNGVTTAGGSQPHENRPPYLAVKCIIALQGIFPSRP